MDIKLHEGEEILFEAGAENRIFSMWLLTKVIPYCVLASLITFLAFMLLWVFFIAIPSGSEDLPFPSGVLTSTFILLPFWFVDFFLYYRKLRRTFRYYVTTQRCLFEGGIMIRRIRSVPYHKITDIEINQNIIEHILNISSLKIFTPGTGSVGAPGFEKAEIVFYGLQDAVTPANIIYNIVKKYKATGE